MSETVPTGWVLTGAACEQGGDPGAITPSTGQAINCTFTNTKGQELVHKSGTDYNDLNGNGKRDGHPLEPVIQGREIKIWSAGQTSVIATQLTDAKGGYDFGVPPGTYVVCETVPVGSTQTYPKAGMTPPPGEKIVACGSGGLGYQVTLAAGKNRTGKTSGAARRSRSARSSPSSRSSTRSRASTRATRGPMSSFGSTSASPSRRRSTRPPTSTATATSSSACLPIPTARTVAAPGNRWS